MGWVVPILIAARKRREEGHEPCDDVWWTLPLIVVSLVVLLVALMVFLGIRLPMVAVTLGIAGLVVLLALVVLVVSLLR
jgi:hypothetical protein